jgi:hypothetical protein
MTSIASVRSNAPNGANSKEIPSCLHEGNHDEHRVSEEQRSERRE